MTYLTINIRKSGVYEETFNSEEVFRIITSMFNMINNQPKTMILRFDTEKVRKEIIHHVVYRDVSKVYDVLISVDTNNKKIEITISVKNVTTFKPMFIETLALVTRVLEMIDKTLGDSEYEVVLLLECKEKENIRKLVELLKLVSTIEKI